MISKCDICGKDVDNQTCIINFVDGFEYYFCSNECIKKFEE